MSQVYRASSMGSTRDADGGHEFHVWLHPEGHRPGEPGGVRLAMTEAECRQLVNYLSGALWSARRVG